VQAIDEELQGRASGRSGRLATQACHRSLRDDAFAGHFRTVRVIERHIAGCSHRRSSAQSRQRHVESSGASMGRWNELAAEAHVSRADPGSDLSRQGRAILPPLSSFLSELRFWSGHTSASGNDECKTLAAGGGPAVRLRPSEGAHSRRAVFGKRYGIFGPVDWRAPVVRGDSRVRNDIQSALRRSEPDQARCLGLSGNDRFLAQRRDVHQWL